MPGEQPQIELGKMTNAAEVILQSLLDKAVSEKLNGIVQQSVDLTEGMGKFEQNECLSFLLEKVEISTAKFFAKMRARLEAKKSS